MRIISLLAALTTSAALVAAGPVNAREKALGDCPNGWEMCGNCNGTKCKIALTDHECDTGSCTAQSGGGDDTICGTFGDPNKIICPGKA